jgi:hypothetical protein
VESDSEIEIQSLPSGEPGFELELVSFEEQLPTQEGQIAPIINNPDQAINETTIRPTDRTNQGPTSKNQQANYRNILKRYLDSLPDSPEKNSLLAYLS